MALKHVFLVLFGIVCVKDAHIIALVDFSGGAKIGR